VRSEIRRRFKSDSISVGVVRRPGFSAASCRFKGLDGARLEFGPGGCAAPRAIGLRTIQPDSRRVAQHVCPEMPADVAEDANAGVRSTASPVEPGFTSRSESVAPAVQTVVALSSSRSQRRVAEAPASRRRLRFRREPGAVSQRARRRAPARLNRIHRESHDRLPRDDMPEWPRAPCRSQVKFVAGRAEFHIRLRKPGAVQLEWRRFEVGVSGG
jgi:hypothetical protein